MQNFDKYFIGSGAYDLIIKDLEEFVYGHENQFFQKFIKSNPEEVIILTKFAINSENVDFTFALYSGQHICDTIRLKDLMLWVAEIDEKEQKEKLKDFNLELEGLVKFLFKVQVGDLTCRLAAQILSEKIEKEIKNAN